MESLPPEQVTLDGGDMPDVSVDRGDSCDDNSVNLTFTRDVCANSKKLQRDNIDIVNGVSGEATDAEVRRSVKGQADEAVRLHRSIASALRGVHSCKHGYRTSTDWICPECCNEVTQHVKVVLLQNSVLARYTWDFARYDYLNPFFSRMVEAVLYNLLEHRTTQVKQYL